jgi:hypothetical protein
MSDTPASAPPPPDRHRAWVADAIAALRAELSRSADTHLPKLPLPASPASTCT